MKPGARVVSHDFDMEDWEPDARAATPGDGSTVYLWVVPAHVAGEWSMNGGATTLTQRFQTFTGSGSDAAGRFSIENGRLEGGVARFDMVRVGARRSMTGEGVATSRTRKTPIQFAADAATSPPRP